MIKKIIMNFTLYLEQWLADVQLANLMFLHFKKNGWLISKAKLHSWQILWSHTKIYIHNEFTTIIVNEKKCSKQYLIHLLLIVSHQVLSNCVLLIGTRMTRQTLLNHSERINIKNTAELQTTFL